MKRIRPEQSSSTATSDSAQNPDAADASVATIDADLTATTTGSSVPANPQPTPDESTESVAAEEPIQPPTIAGVVADKVVIWNQHNGAANDRGTAVCNLLLVRAGEVIWRKDAIQVPWSENRDTKVEVAIPSEPFDRVRVEVTKLTKNTSGGLAEIQVMRGATNLARGCPVVASGYWENNVVFRPELVVDGITTSAVINEGYWLMPDGILGWIEVDLAAPRPEDYTGLTADKVVVWNQHNAEANDRGTREFDLVLLLADREVWRRKDVPIPWRPNEDIQVPIDLPQIGFDRVRVEIDKIEGGRGGGLAEIQVFRGDENVARGAPALAESFHLPEFAASRVTDGITSSATLGVGYWLFEGGPPAWLEIDLVRHSPQLAETARRLGEYRCFVEGDWAHGLPWLLRCDNAGLRNLAEAEQLDPSGAAELVSLGDAWWDLADASPAAYRDKLRGRALWRYVRALPGLVEFSKPRIEKRIADVLPTLPERHFLYFIQEMEVGGIPVNRELRQNGVIFEGLPRPYGLWMHGTESGSSQAKFRLDKRYRRLIGAAGINDGALNRTETALTFRVVADGRPLWKSKPLKQFAASEAFDLDVSGVDVLELFVDCPGTNRAAHAVWIDPRLEE